MRAREIKDLEMDLRGDLEDMPAALIERVRKDVKRFLLHEASKLTGRQVKDEADILSLIELHARVNLLKKLIENPTGFNVKDQKELFKSIGDDRKTKELDKPADPIRAVAELDIPDDAKAKIYAAMTEAVAGQIRAQLKAGS